MILSRPWLPLVVAGCLVSAMAGAQDTTGGSAPGAGAGGSAAGSPAAGSPAAGSSSTPGASSQFGTAPSAPSTPANPNAPNQGALPFGTQNPNAPNAPNQGTQGQGTQGTAPGQPAAEGQDNTAPGGSASAFGSPEKPGGSQLQQAPATFTVPGFYGRGPETFTVGQGRLARPHFRFSGNIAVGYDDNVFATPTHAQAVPTQKVQQEVAAGTPAAQVQVLVPSGDPNVPSTTQTQQIPAVPPKFRTVSIPGVPAAQRIPSWITRTDAKWDVQFASRKTLFTFDLGAGVDYYWDRPGKKEDYTGNVSMIYLRKMSGRAQFTFSLDTSYQSQPDFSQPNVPTSPNVGSYIAANAKADLSYRLTPRFSAVASLTYNTIQYQQSTAQAADNYATTTIGTEVRYLSSPRLTVVGEVRASQDKHTNNPLLDTTSYYALLGTDLQLSRRFTTTLRVGEQVQTFTQGGSKSSAPYGEFTLGYRLGYATTVAWNARYGYEEAGTPNTTDLVARTGLQLTQIFTPRFQSVLSVNLVQSSVTTSPSTTGTSTSSSSASTTSSITNATGSSTTSAAGTTATATPASTAATSAASSSSSSASSKSSSAGGSNPASGANPNASTSPLSTNSVSDTIDASLGFYYTLNRHWSFNLTYSYTTGLGPINVDDYFRQRLFLGASYQF